MVITSYAELKENFINNEISNQEFTEKMIYIQEKKSQVDCIFNHESSSYKYIFLNGHKVPYGIRLGTKDYLGNLFLDEGIYEMITPNDTLRKKEEREEVQKQKDLEEKKKLLEEKRKEALMLEQELEQNR